MQGLTVAAAGRGVVAEDGVSHIEVVVRGQVARLGIWCIVDDPEIRLRVGPNRLSDRAMEGEAAAVGTESEVADTHGNGG